MESVERLFTLSFPQLILGILVAMAGFTAIIVIINQFFDKVLKKPFLFWKNISADHKLLEETIQELKCLSSRHDNDVKQSIAHDKRIKEDLDLFISEMKKSILDNQKEIKQFYENRAHDREQSFGIQKELTEAQNKIALSVKEISEQIYQMKCDTDKRFLESEEKQNKKEQAKIKSEISKYYSLYHERQSISDIELEALEGLIDTYERYGGSNSFVHSVVQKEMYIWKRENK